MRRFTHPRSQQGPKCCDARRRRRQIHPRHPASVGKDFVNSSHGMSVKSLPQRVKSKQSNRAKKTSTPAVSLNGKWQRWGAKMPRGGKREGAGRKHIGMPSPRTIKEFQTKIKTYWILRKLQAHIEIPKAQCVPGVTAADILLKKVMPAYRLRRAFRRDRHQVRRIYE